MVRRVKGHLDVASAKVMGSIPTWKLNVSVVRNYCRQGTVHL